MANVWAAVDHDVPGAVRRRAYLFNRVNGDFPTCLARQRAPMSGELVSQEIGGCLTCRKLEFGRRACQPSWRAADMVSGAVELRREDQPRA